MYPVLIPLDTAREEAIPRSGRTVISSFSQNSTYFRSSSATSLTYSVRQLCFCPVPPFSRTLENPSAPHEICFIFRGAALHSTKFLMYRLYLLTLTEALVSKTASSDAIRRSPLSASCSRKSVSSITRLGTLSHSLSLSSSFIVNVSTLEIAEPASR